MMTIGTWNLVVGLKKMSDLLSTLNAMTEKQCDIYLYNRRMRFMTLQQRCWLVAIRNYKREQILEKVPEIVYYNLRADWGRVFY
jgi:hypothetical protein